MLTSILTSWAYIDAMRYLSEIQEFVLDCDGSSRDITFTPVQLGPLAGFVSSLLQRYSLASALDNDECDQAESIRSGDLPKLLHAESGYLHITLDSAEAMLPHLQVFIDWPDSDGFGLELSFFPNDIDRKTFEIRSFVDLIQAWNGALHAEDYFVRYENASWDLYDPKGLGVIYTGQEMNDAQQGHATDGAPRRR